MRAAFSFFSALVLAAAGLRAQTTVDPAHPYAYGANTGWINAAGDGVSGAVIGRYFCWGYLYSPAIGWISLGSGIPANGYSYSNLSRNDYGVNHDEAGALRGYAYSANTGWIVFEERGNPQVDLQTGALSGFVYGANTGWISLSNGQAYLRTTRLDSGPDKDGNGIPDAWEFCRFGFIGIKPGGDQDDDGVSDFDEYRFNTDPGKPTGPLCLTLVREKKEDVLFWVSSRARLYQLQSASSLQSAWTNVSLVTGTGSDVSAASEPSTGGTRFYRVTVVMPLE